MVHTFKLIFKLFVLFGLFSLFRAKILILIAYFLIEQHLSVFQLILALMQVRQLLEPSCLLHSLVLQLFQKRLDAAVFFLFNQVPLALGALLRDTGEARAFVLVHRESVENLPAPIERAHHWPELAQFVAVGHQFLQF